MWSILRAMQTAMHIMSLVTELKREIIGGKIVGAEFYKKDRSVCVFVRNKRKLALVFSYHPTGAGAFLIPASKLRITTREKPRPVFGIDGATIVSIEQLGFDRIFTMTVEQGGEAKNLVFEAIGPNGNVWLLSDRGAIQATLRKKAYQQDAIYRPPASPDKLNPLDLSAAVLARQIKKETVVSLVHFIEKFVLGCNRTISREITSRAGLDSAEIEEFSEDAFIRLAGAFDQVVGFFKTPDVGYLYELGTGLEAYPFRLSSRDEKPERFKTLSLAVRAMTERRQATVAEEDKEKRAKSAVKRVLRRLEKRLVNVEKDIVEAADYERHKKTGELLQINLHRIRKGMDSIIVDDIYVDPHQEITIKLDPALAPHENASAYFRKYRKGRSASGLLQRRLEVTKAELGAIRKIHSELEADFDTAQDRYRQEIASILPKAATKRQVPLRLPYREFTLSTGVRVFVGRDGSDNDRTTFEFARPFELWFHAQQCPGSHVVMKFPNKSFEPSRSEIEETAAIAAYFSKARNDSLVPVIYTSRKYVRKPRKADTGLVTVEREKSIMVAPRKPRVA